MHAANQRQHSATASSSSSSRHWHLLTSFQTSTTRRPRTSRQGWAGAQASNGAIQRSRLSLRRSLREASHCTLSGTLRSVDTRDWPCGRGLFFFVAGLPVSECRALEHLIVCHKGEGAGEPRSEAYSLTCSGARPAIYVGATDGYRC
jgi:hypothetical protein